MQEIDYRAFCHVDEKGRIPWRLEDAFKLGAGYLPVSDDDQQLVATLIAPNNRVKANERDILAAFHDDHLKERFNLATPPVFEQEDEKGRGIEFGGTKLAVKFVDAGKFLDWLSQYIAFTQANMSPPNEIVKAIREAKARQSLTVQPTPSDTEEYSRAWSLWCELDSVRDEIRKWEMFRPQSITEKATQDDRVQELRGRERALDAELDALDALSSHVQEVEQPATLTRSNRRESSKLSDLPHGPDRDRQIYERYMVLKSDGKKAPLERLSSDVGVSKSAVKQAMARHKKKMQPSTAIVAQLTAANPKR